MPQICLNSFQRTPYDYLCFNHGKLGYIFYKSKH